MEKSEQLDVFGHMFGGISFGIEDDLRIIGERTGNFSLAMSGGCSIARDGVRSSEAL